LNKLWQQLAIATNWPVVAAVVVLTSVGVLTIWADQPQDALRQLMFMGVGLACMFLFQAVDYRTIGRWSWAFYVLSLLLVGYTVLPFTHVPQGSRALFRVPYKGGAYNWINCGSFSVQPSELVKIAFVLVLAHYLRFRSNYRTFGGLIPPFALGLVPVALILKQPDLGTSLVFIPTLFVMLYVAGAKLRHLLAVAGMGLAAAPVLWLAGPADQGAPGLPLLRHLPAFVKPYQRARVMALLNEDPAMAQTTNYQTQKAMIAFASGGPTGKGPGSIPIGRSVPEGHNDMIFALVGEQFGFAGSAVVLIAYIVLFAAGVEIASATREPFGRLVAPGVVAILAAQTFINLMVVLRLMPVTGVTLPFVSYGGSSLIASFMAAGLLLNIGQSRPIIMAKEAFQF
jgi:cell division protein FtsW (lipid II flippase)